MRAKSRQNTRCRTQNKAVAGCFYLGLAATILCFSPSTPAVAKDNSASNAVHGTPGLISSRTLLLMMLDSLLDALADDLADPGPGPEPEYVAWTENDGLEQTAQMFMSRYSEDGVDPGLMPAEILEAIDTTDDAEQLILSENLGLDQQLEGDLLNTLQLMRADLEEVAP